MHKCPGTRCGGQAQVPDHMLMCRQDWYAVPAAERNAVWAAWDGGRGAGTPEHRDAVLGAIGANRSKETSS